MYPLVNSQAVTQLKVVPANSALRLRAVLDFDERDGTKRVAGDEWLFEGPGKREITHISRLCKALYSYNKMKSLVKNIIMYYDKITNTFFVGVI